MRTRCGAMRRMSGGLRGDAAHMRRIRAYHAKRCGACGRMLRKGKGLGRPRSRAAKASGTERRCVWSSAAPAPCSRRVNAGVTLMIASQRWRGRCQRVSSALVWRSLRSVENAGESMGNQVGRSPGGAVREALGHGLTSAASGLRAWARERSDRGPLAVPSWRLDYPPKHEGGPFWAAPPTGASYAALAAASARRRSSFSCQSRRASFRSGQNSCRL
jgi:hypothetical protein